MYNVWHENIFRRHWNICQIYVKYILVNIFNFYKENISKVYFNYIILCENIFHIFDIYVTHTFFFLM